VSWPDLIGRTTPAVGTTGFAARRAGRSLGNGRQGRHVSGPHEKGQVSISWTLRLCNTVFDSLAAAGEPHRDELWQGSRNDRYLELRLRAFLPVHIGCLRRPGQRVRRDAVTRPHRPSAGTTLSRSRSSPHSRVSSSTCKPGPPAPWHGVRWWSTSAGTKAPGCTALSVAAGLPNIRGTEQDQESSLTKSWRCPTSRVRSRLRLRSPHR
jgi:hypothetical protein